MPADDPTMPEVRPWEWDEQTWRPAVERVRAGRRLLRPAGPERWPNGARAAVLISFDSDHETGTLRSGDTSPGGLSVGEYGARAAVPRILALLERWEVPASFFIPAVCALLRPGEAPGYVARGHEVGVHGWIHENNTDLTAAEELDLDGRAMDVLESQTGIRPVGIRTPAWDFSDSTLSVIRELGFRYDSSLMADDDPYEILADGEPTGVVEIPVEWIRDDYPVLATDTAVGLRPSMSPRDLGRVWADEFDGAYAEGGVFQLTMHPHVIGHRSRIVMLDELLAHIREHDDLWVTTHADLAAYVAATPAPGATV